MNTFRTSSSYIEDYNSALDAEDMEFMMNPNDYIPIPNQDNVGTVYIRISLPELNIQKCLQFQLGESIWHAKQQILASFGSELRDGYNYGLYCPPQNGKAGKFLDEERLLREYPLTGPIGYLEFKFKRRVYRSMELNTRKLKQIHNKANLKQFMDAVKHGNKERVDKFLIKGLDPNYIDRDSGETPLTLSCTLGSDKSRSMIITLVSGGAHMDFRNRHGFTPMHKSGICSNRESIKTLLDLGASPNYKDLRYLTPLYYAVSKDDPVCTELLLNERAIIGTTDEQGWFEIHQACRSGKVQILEHLIYYGADMDVQNASGNTPLHVCAVTNQESCIRVLLFRGANKVIVNLNNQTPYEAAIIAGNLDLAEIIKGYSSADIVPFRELPQYSSRRTIKYKTNFRLSKCRSESRLNLSMMDSNFFKPDGRFHRYSMSSDCYSVTNSDSPRSISSSSTYSGQINGGLHTPDHDYYDGRRENYEENWYPYSVEDTDLNSRRRTCSLGDLDADTEYFQRKTIKQRALFNHLGRHFINNYAPRTVFLQKTPNGYGFVLRGAKSDPQFLQHVSNNSPAMQYLDTVDVGSVAEKAGLRAGDFILEINDENVNRASHEQVVRLIKNSGNTLKMTVLTVKPTDQDKNTFVHEDGSFTLPSRRRQAPEPPRRDPSTSLSFSKAKSKSFAEGMAEIEKLDQTLAEFEVCDSPSKENSYSTNQNTMKTASIRAAYAKKRLSSIEIDNICSKPDRLSPSEVRIKKYHKKNSSLEKSRSTPNLAPDIDYMGALNSSENGSYSSNSSGPLRSQQAKMNATHINQLYPAPYLGSLSHAPPGMDLSGCRHSVAIGSSVQINSLPSRGKAYPVPPPMVANHYISPKEHAPTPQVVTINTLNDQPVGSTVGLTKQNSYESSFRPGTVAVFGNNKKLATNPSSVNPAKSHKAASNFNSNLNSVTKTVIADVHYIDQSQGTQQYSNGNHTLYEPLPDYDSEAEDNLSNVNVISVGPNLPNNRMSLAVPASSPSSSESFNTASTTPSFQNTIDPQIIPPPPEFCPPPPPTFSHAPPPPPPQQFNPPPAPPPPQQSCPLPPPPPQFSSAPLPETQASQTADQGNELLNEIKRAAQERLNRSKDEIPEKKLPKPVPVNLTPQDKNQAEILQAVAKRRSMLENADGDNVVNQIEAQIHKAKKLQYSKYYFTGNRMKKEVKDLPEENRSEVEENKPNFKEINKPDIKVNRPDVMVNKPDVKVTKLDAKSHVKQKELNERKMNSASSEDKPISKPLLKPKLLEKSTDKLPTESISNKTIEKTSISTLQNQAIKSQNVKVEPHVNNDSKKGQEDFLTKAEKARQRYLSRKSLGTNNETVNKPNRTATQSEKSDMPNSINAHSETSDKPNRTATHTVTIDKPNKIAINNEKSDKLNSTAINNVKSDKSYNIAKVNENKTYKEPEKCVISNKTVEKQNKINTDQTRRGVPTQTTALIKRTASNKVHIEIKPAVNVSPKPISGVSIKERIANLQNNNGLATNNSRDGVKLITVKGVTTGHSNTDPSNSSDCSTPSQSPYHSNFVTIVAPPPGFCDSDSDERATDELSLYPTLQTLPAPLTELSISVDQIGDIHPPDDSLSLISSLSTLSTLSTSSTEHQIDIVHPPPTIFQYGSSPVSTDQGFEESFIAAPQEFNEPLKKHNTTKHSYQNKSIEDWLYMDVLEWLDSLKLTQYKTNFSHHCIDGKKLLNLNRNDYLMLGITQVSHRLGLEKAIKKALLASKIPVGSKISS